MTWSVYERIIVPPTAGANRRRGKSMMTALINSLRRGARGSGGTEPELGRTLWRRRADVLAFFDHPHIQRPTEAINGRQEALRRNALASATSPTTGCAHYCTAATSFNRSTHCKSGRA